jgi:putative ABC transport system permease protein
LRFISIPARNLGRRPIRTHSTALSVTIAVASFIALVGLSRGLGQAWTETLRGRGVDVVASRKGAWVLLTGSIDERVADDLRKVRGVRAVATGLVDLVVAESGRPMVVEGWAMDSFLWKTLSLRVGRLPKPEETNGALLGEGAAELLGKKPGDSLSVQGKQFVVTGVYLGNGALANFSILMPLTTLQGLLGRSGKVTGFDLRLDRPDDAASVVEVRSRLAAAFPDLLFTESNDMADQDNVQRVLRAVAWITSAIALIMALVVILNTLLLSVTERTHEIGILSALGWPSERILLMIVLEGLILAAAGSVAGALLGIAGMNWLTSLPQAKGFIVPVISWRLVLEVTGAALFLGAMGSIYPAARAVSLEPVDALRYE